ncbi:hypothetical protein CH330_02520 [candidate division WOR-3 bacterium JGI_Cruoil_03_51_56]|uniref:Metallo-beta-lactamase domain-containing protein n=1 Tax=candidate division WOR-3 bacterium JGI_Cruoil_03_51_56 TaxID=1973747 RepID=A0A235BXP7_UNCW3|nr:MAG: hypothetical protein CH330_02520 [candidate division WOR-3 bacterium JGI_Cruoil_03_51_56]
MDKLNRYIVQKKEWEDATNPDPRSKTAYLEENFLPVQKAGQLQLIDGDHELLPGIKLILTGGHTRGHQIVLSQSNGQTSVFWSDIIPTTSHISIPYVTAYDLFPLETMEKKKELVARAIRGKWVCFFVHDPKLAAGIISRKNRSYYINQIMPIAIKGEQNG